MNRITIVIVAVLMPTAMLTTLNLVQEVQQRNILREQVRKRGAWLNAMYTTTLYNDIRLNEICIEIS